MIDYPPRGLIANLITPLTRAGDPDPEALACLIRRIKNEVAGFLVGGWRLGEASALERADRLALLSTVITTSGADQPLFFEITGRTEAETLDVLAGAEALLADVDKPPLVFYLLTPLVFHGNRDLPQYLRRLGDNSRRRIILANDPATVGKIRARLRHKNIRTAVLKKVAINEQVAGLAYNGGLERAMHYQRALRTRPGFRFYDGDERNFIQRPSASGLISGGVLLMPRAWAGIVRSSLNVFDAPKFSADHLGQIWNDGRSVQALAEVYRRNPPAFIKKALWHMKIVDCDKVLPGTPSLDAEESRLWEARLRELHLA